MDREARKHGITKLKVFDYGVDAYKGKDVTELPETIKELWRLYNYNIDSFFRAKWTPGRGWTW